MKYKKGMQAVIDLGSKGYKVEVFDADYNSVGKRRVSTNMGLTFTRDGSLSPEGRAKFSTETIAIAYFSNVANELIALAIEDWGFPREAVTVVATAASRNLYENEEGWNMFRNAIKLPFTLLSALEECSLSRLGFVSSYKRPVDEGVLYVDLGGASTELSVSSIVGDQADFDNVYTRAKQETRMHAGISIPYGSNRLPTEINEINEVRHLVSESFFEFKIREVAIAGSAWNVVAKNHFRSKATACQDILSLDLPSIIRQSDLKVTGLVSEILRGLDLEGEAIVYRCKGGLRLGAILANAQDRAEGKRGRFELSPKIVEVPGVHMPEFAQQKIRLQPAEYDKGLYKVMADYANKYERAPA